MALVEGGGGSPRGRGGAAEEPLSESALAQIFGAVSDRASVQGGKVIDIGEVFVQALAGEDTVTGEAGFEEAPQGRPVRELVDLVREAARAEGVDTGRVDESLHVRLVEEVEQKKGAFGWYEDGMVFVKDWTRDGHDGSLTIKPLLHEASHAMVMGQEDDTHGPLWRRVYGRALDLALPAEKAAEERERIETRYADDE